MADWVQRERKILPCRDTPGVRAARSRRAATDRQLACALASPFSRGRPMRAGWKSTAAASVQTSDSARSLPMLDVPGWLENQRLPNAVAVVSALKITARVRLDCKRLVCPSRHAIT